MRDNASLRMVQIILDWAWDPIGVRGIEGAADEYDMYAPPVLEMLEADAPVEQIAGYLTKVVRDRMELPVRPGRGDDVSRMLQQLILINRVSRTATVHPSSPFRGERCAP